MKKLLLIALLLASCENRPDAPTATQNAQLDEAEAMLDEAGEEVPEICETRPPQDDAKYEEWREEALDAGCDKLSMEKAGGASPRPF